VLIERVRSVRNSRSESKALTSAPSPRFRLFCQPNLLEGEDGGAFEELLAHVRAAVKPADIIDEIFISDVVSLQWEVLRWNRLKSRLIQARWITELEVFLGNNLRDDLWAEHFADELSANLQSILPRDQAEHARTLADKYARNEAKVIDEVDKLLARVSVKAYDIINRAQALKAEELVQEYSRGEPEAVTLVDEHLSDAGVTVDTLMARGLVEKLDDIERIDCLTSIAENRRNASLREIERRRAVLGEALRRVVPEIEDGEFKKIQTPSAKGKNAA
jgi:hypothetical protein